MAIDKFHVLGIDHHNAPVSVRERVAINPGTDLTEAVSSLAALPSIDEVMLLSTCNRFEAYWVGDADANDVLQAIAEERGCDLNDLTAHHTTHDAAGSVRHLFRVAGSLESLVVGEYQIVHQMRHAYETARVGGHAGAVLNRVCQRALATAKRVRSDTAIGRYRLSIASVAVDLARQIHGRLSKARLLVVGAGEMAELAVQHLIGEGVTSIDIVNRRTERALALADAQQEGVSVTVHQWADLGDRLREADIVVSSTAAPHAVITHELAKRALRRRRSPLMLLDLAVPRDIESSIADLDDAYLYNVDHLEQVVASNQTLRQGRGRRGCSIG